MSIAVGISLLFAVSITANAGPGGGPPPCQPWEWPCGGGDDGDEGNGVDVDIENNNNAYGGKATAFGGAAFADGGDAKAYGGDGGDGGDANINIGNGMFNKNLSPEANATIEKGAIKNTIDNKNTNMNTNLNTNFNTNKNDIDIDNKNTNLNTNINSNKQGQDQGQSQGQLQGQDQNQGQLQGQGQSQDASNKQGQSQDASNKQGQAQKTTVIITDNTVVEDQYNHITGPGLMKSDAKLGKGKAMSIKTEGWGIVNFLNHVYKAEAKKLGKDADDFKIKEAILFEETRIDSIRVLHEGDTPTGKFMGFLYLIPNGKDVSAAGGVGRLLEKGMWLGATHIGIVKKDNKGNFSMGDSWNIGLGGGASLAADGGDKMIAPNGGLGFGKAEAHNELRPAAMAVLYYDETFIK